jgi:hypothetical protein
MKSNFKLAGVKLSIKDPGTKEVFANFEVENLEVNYEASVEEIKASVDGSLVLIDAIKGIIADIHDIEVEERDRLRSLLRDINSKTSIVDDIVKTMAASQKEGASNV